jgi:FlaA1/EpsC-like NDP-sugar epimerase
MISRAIRNGCSFLLIMPLFGSSAPDQFPRLLVCRYFFLNFPSTLQTAFLLLSLITIMTSPYTQSFSPIFQKRHFNIEDLLGREQIVLNDQNIRKNIHKKRIMITGAAGSIGSELARQIASFEPAELILIDKVETNLVNLENTLRRIYGPRLNLNTQYADITNSETVLKVFQNSEPEIVYHTAALKHVPFVEKFVADAVKINILGTQILADIAAKMKVEKFVFVSSDKAVNPASVMGATKRFGELIMLTKNRISPSKTQFVCARFGNVLGSSGSVVPAFESQLAYENCLYVTHQDVERYFMTPFEAGQLLLESASIGGDGQVLIFDMGRPIKIYDLAIRFIELNGLQPHTEVPIVITGLRPGEKLFEDLRGENDYTMPSHHPKIMIAGLEMSTMLNIENHIGLLKKAARTGKASELIALLKTAVPEYTPAKIAMG